MTLSIGVARAVSFHTSRASISLDTTDPWFRNRYSSRSYSRAVSSIGVSSARDGSGSRIQSEVPDRHPSGLLGAAAPKKRADAGKQLRKRERLYQIIIRACIQPVNPIIDRISRRQQEGLEWQFRFCGVARGSQSRCCPGSITSSINEIEPLRVQKVKAFFSRFRNGDFIAFILESLLHGVRQLRLIFHDKDMHAFFHIARLPAAVQLKSF